MPIITIEHLTKSYGDARVLDDLQLNIEKEEILCIVGPSGCGKSTLLNILSGTTTPDSGHITGLDELKISYVFQDPLLIPWRTIEENLSFVMDRSLDPSLKKTRIARWLDRVELEDTKQLYPAQLSGGMEQRASLARAFCVDSDLLLMDEPFKGLDEPLKLRMLRLIFKLYSTKPKTILFVTHDIREALMLGDRVIVLGEKATKVIGDVKITIPHHERRIGCPRLGRMEEEIAHLMDQSTPSARRCQGQGRWCNFQIT